MPIPVLMPALSPTMEEGTLAKWLVKEGDTVSAGDVIAEIETDKATMEVEAVDEGKVGKIVVEAGTEGVAVNAPIAYLLEDGESADDIDESEGAAAETGHKSEKGNGAGGAAAPAESSSGQYKEARSSTDGGRISTPPSSAPEIYRADADPDIPEGTEMVQTSIREALRDAMAEEMRRDDSVFVMGEEVAYYEGAYKVTQGLLDEFGDKRVVDTPITEHGFAGLGVGAAFAGLKPVVEFMTWNFAMQAIDHIINSAAKTLYMAGGKMGCPIVFRGPNGVASRVGAQHAQNYAPWYAHVPGLKVIAPYSAADAKGLLKAAIRDPNPVVFLEHELLYGKSFDVPKLDDFVLPIGRARIVRSGDDVTIVSYSRGIEYALQAADALQEEDISAEIVDLRTLRPMDTKTVVESVMRTNRCIAIDEGWPVCSIGSEISAVLMEYAFDYLDAPVRRIAQADVPLPYADNLEKLALPQVDDIVRAAKEICYRV